MKTTLAGVLGALVFGMPTFAAAQQDPNNINIPSLEYQQADVREALRSLFKSAGLSYSISTEVQGTVTLSLKNVPFETALQNIVRQVDATYRVEDGIFQIVKRPPDFGDPVPPTPFTAPDTHVTRTIKIRTADPALIALLLSKSGQSYNGSPEITSLGRFIHVGGGSGLNGGGGSGLGSGFGNGQSNGFGGGQGSGFGNGQGSGFGNSGGSVGGPRG